MWLQAHIQNHKLKERLRNEQTKKGEEKKQLQEKEEKEREQIVVGKSKRKAATR